MSKLLKIVISCGVVWFAEYAYGVPSYPLTCRGGGNGNAGIYGNATGASVQFTFVRGTSAAHEGVNPGECTWSDRGMRSTEPNLVCHTVTNQYPKVSWNIRGRTVTNARVGQLSYIDSLTYSNFYQIFQVYNDGSGCLMVTRVGP